MKKYSLTESIEVRGKRLVRITAAVNGLNITPVWARKLAQTGRVPAVKNGKTWFIDAQALADFCRNMSTSQRLLMGL